MAFVKYAEASQWPNQCVQSTTAPLRDLLFTVFGYTLPKILSFRLPLFSRPSHPIPLREQRLL